MTPNTHQERTFQRRLASHTLAAALGLAIGSAIGFYKGYQVHAQEECLRKGMEVRFEQDFPQFRNWQQTNAHHLAQVRSTYATGIVIREGPTYSFTYAADELLEKAAARGREAEQTLERECAENPRRYRY